MERPHLSLVGFAVAAVVLVSGCTDGRIALLPGESPPSLLKSTVGSEAVAGHTTPTKTWPGGYTVRSSTGTIASKPLGVTPNGFRIYSSVQGALVSDDVGP